MCFEDDDESVLSSGVSSERPHFLHDEITVNTSVQLGSTAHLHCRVTGLKDQSVSCTHIILQS